MPAHNKIERVRTHPGNRLGIRILCAIVIALCTTAVTACSNQEPADGTPSPVQETPVTSVSSTATHLAATATATATTKLPTSTPTPKPPTATPTPEPPTPTPTPKGYTFGAGAQLVGTDIQPATYRTRSASRGCYWERLSGLGGTLDEILANDNTDGPAVVTIGAADKAFSSKRCGPWTQDLSPITQGTDAPFSGHGTYIVGVDIAPGTWRNDGSANCYWARLAGFSGTLDDIIANDNPDGTAIVTIAATDKGFMSNRCGIWTKVQ